MIPYRTNFRLTNALLTELDFSVMVAKCAPDLTVPQTTFDSLLEWYRFAMERLESVRQDYIREGFSPPLPLS